MAGRGRGRGRGLSFNVEQLGFGRGEALPTPVLQPPPLFPVLQYKPVPLVASEEQEYLLALKQEFQGSMRESQFNIKPMTAKNDIERYSDRYQSQINQSNQLQFDWKRFPKELRPIFKRKKVAPAPCPKIKVPKISSTDNVEQKLEVLEKEEKNSSDAEEEKAEKENEDDDEKEEEEEEYYDEEEQEEGTDYILPYFDNGENYFDEEDDNLDDGPVY